MNAILNFDPDTHQLVGPAGHLPIAPAEPLAHRFLFLDPEASPEVITQRLQQTHFRISLRSVHRIIADYGLQKKLYALNPRKPPPTLPTQRAAKRVVVEPADPRSLQREVRQLLADRLSGNLLGLALLLPEHLRLGQMTLALVAQALIHQLRQRLGAPFNQWDALHLAQDLFAGLEGDLRVHQDLLLVTYYNAPQAADWKHHFENLPQRLESKGVDPRIPWLDNFKLDFRFR